MIRRIFSLAYHQAEQEIIPTGRTDRKVILICITVAVCVTMIHYWGNVDFMIGLLRDWGLNSWSSSLDQAVSSGDHSRLYKLIYWVGTVIFFYLVPPLLLIKLVFKESLSQYGLSFKGAFKDHQVYLAMLLVMLPLVWYFSRTHSFQDRYPFYELNAGEGFSADFWIWELFYLVQFFALEFFFRGFMLHGTKRKFGYYSVVVMTIPYCMIHFGKPMPETLAAIIAGFVLGTLSLKSRSIWLGVAIHYSVAITMDLMALYQKGLF